MRTPSSNHATAFICIQVAVLAAALTLPAKASSFTVFASADSFGVGDSVKITILSDPRKVSCLGAKIVYTLAQGSPTFELSPPSSTTRRESKQLSNGWTSIDLSSGIAELTLTGSVEPAPKTACQSEAATTEAQGQSNGVKVALLLRPLGKNGPARDRNQATIPAQSLNLTFRPPAKPTQTPPPQASVKMLDPKGKTVRLTRRTPLPWSPAHGQTVVWLSVSNGPLNVRDLDIVLPPSHNAHGESVTDGKVTLLRDSQSSGSAKAGSAIPLNLKLEDFRTYGDHEIAFTVDGLPLKEAQLVTIKLAVTDSWLLPVMVIAFGVLLVFGAPLLRNRMPAGPPLNRALSALRRSAELLSQRANEPSSSRQPVGQADELPNDQDGALGTAELAVEVPTYLSWIQRVKHSPVFFHDSRLAEGERLAGRLGEDIQTAKEMALAPAEAALDSESSHPETDKELDMARELVEEAKRELAHGRTILQDARATPEQKKLVKIAVVAAILTGIHQLYLGQVFGSPKQYLGALLWGSGLQAGLSALPGFLNRLMSGLKAAASSPGS